MPSSSSALGLPTPAFNLIVQQLRCWGPATLCAPAAGELRCSADRGAAGSHGTGPDWSSPHVEPTESCAHRQPAAYHRSGSLKAMVSQEVVAMLLATHSRPEFARFHFAVKDMIS
jgi:hypothetical protein